MSARIRSSTGLIKLHWIPRYTTLERMLHWGHTATFLALAATGLILFVPWFAPLARGEAGQFVRLVHRICSVVFAAVPIIYAILAPRRLLLTLRELSFDRTDIDWLKAAIPYYLLGKHLTMPAQRRWNTGEKINAIALVLGTILFTLTGVLMWFGKGIMPVWLYRTSVIIHDLAMIVSLNMFIIHFYLAVAHPLMWQSLVSMRFGVVSESYARHHHGRWYWGGDGTPPPGMEPPSDAEAEQH
jgi:formate dehydrogenase subunit gamma